MLALKSTLATMLVGLLLVAAPTSAPAQNGRVASWLTIGSGAGGFPDVLSDGDLFATGLAALGDIDGDGTPDAAAGAPRDDDGGPSRGAAWVLFLNSDGTVRATQKISTSQGGFSGALDNTDEFGTSTAGIPDLDGDGRNELAVGAPYDDDGLNDAGAVWLLFPNADGTEKSLQKISATTGGLTGPLALSDGFGWSVASLGDLDNDGNADLAVGAPFDDDGGVNTFVNKGAVWILFLNADGTVAAEQKISSLAGGFTGVLDDYDYFGASVAGIGDLDKDGVLDLAVGATNDNDGGKGRGAVWILFLNADGTVRDHQKISDTAGGFTGFLRDTDEFASSLAPLGDLDDDGDVDLVVGARMDDDLASSSGSLWVLFLNPDGTVKANQKISESQGGFYGNLNGYDKFGSSVAVVGDLDGDSIAELLVGAPFDDTGGTSRGAAWTLFLDGAPLSLCTEQPLSGCDASGTGRLKLQNKDPNSKDRLTWVWNPDTSTTLATLGDPTSGTYYALCIWDYLAATPIYKAGLAMEPGPLWRSRKDRGFNYRDRSGSPDGVFRVKLSAPASQPAKLRVMARGELLPIPVPVESDRFFDQDPNVLVQLVNSIGNCWDATFGPPAKTNTAENFIGRVK